MHEICEAITASALPYSATLFMKEWRLEYLSRRADAKAEDRSSAWGP